MYPAGRGSSRCQPEREGAQMRENELSKQSAPEKKPVMAPVTAVSPWMNLLLCFLASLVSLLVPQSERMLKVIVFLVSFGAMYALILWLMNRKGSRDLPEETESGEA